MGNFCRISLFLLFLIVLSECNPYNGKQAARRLVGRLKRFMPPHDPIQSTDEPMEEISDEMLQQLIDAVDWSQPPSRRILSFIPKASPTPHH